jgi:hypothetical protein
VASPFLSNVRARYRPPWRQRTFHRMEPSLSVRFWVSTVLRISERCSQGVLWQDRLSTTRPTARAVVGHLDRAGKPPVDRVSTDPRRTADPASDPELARSDRAPHCLDVDANELGGLRSGVQAFAGFQRFAYREKGLQTSSKFAERGLIEHRRQQPGQLGERVTGSLTHSQWISGGSPPASAGSAAVPRSALQDV